MDYVLRRIGHGLYINIICKAETGAGKTLAYGIPLVERLRDSKVFHGLQHPRQIAEPRAIIIAPTRELVIEVHRTLLDLCYCSKVRPIAVYGGAPIDAQQEKLRQGCDILVATPGRLLHLLRRDLGKRQTISVEKVEFVVYDEADELLHCEDANEVLRHEGMPDMEPPSGFGTFKEEINQIEQLLYHSHQFIHHWFFSSQYIKGTYPNTKACRHLAQDKRRQKTPSRAPCQREGQ